MFSYKYYFQGRKDLLQGLTIDKFEKKWAEYPVFHISFGTANFTKRGTLDDVIDKYLADADNDYQINSKAKDYGLRFKDILKATHKKTGRMTSTLNR